MINVFETVSRCSPGCPGAQCVDQTGRELTEMRVLELKVCPTTVDNKCFMLWFLYSWSVVIHNDYSFIPEPSTCSTSTSLLGSIPSPIDGVWRLIPRFSSFSRPYGELVNTRWYFKFTNTGYKLGSDTCLMLSILFFSNYSFLNLNIMFCMFQSKGTKCNPLHFH